MKSILGQLQNFGAFATALEKTLDGLIFFHKILTEKPFLGKRVTSSDFLSLGTVTNRDLVQFHLSWNHVNNCSLDCVANFYDKTFDNVGDPVHVVRGNFVDCWPGIVFNLL